ncbi:MAG: hypothetical protein A2Z14_17025 [Chloroflexi bacterium RBG_16_48_8]|nr:MAG: hypothetical protein A2Z14_17025 [Chloroflexi bacterium RBG_16_48_8]
MCRCHFTPLGMPCSLGWVLETALCDEPWIWGNLIIILLLMAAELLPHQKEQLVQSSHEIKKIPSGMIRSLSHVLRKSALV